MNNVVKATKGKTTWTQTGFTTTHYYKNEFVGKSTFDYETHFGWTLNADGSVTIAATKVHVNQYGLGRGMMESLTNCYASAKQYGLNACVTMFTKRLAALYAGVVTRQADDGDDFDVDAETLQLVIGKSLVKEYNFTNMKEVRVLKAHIETAAAQVAERTGIEASTVKAKWLAELDRQNAEIPTP